MKKWLLSLTVALLCVVCLAAEPAHAATVDSGKCGDNVTWTLDDSGTLTISGSGAMWDYAKTSTTAPWYGNKQVCKLVVNEGITYIGSYNFYYTPNLKEASLPSTLKTIGSYGLANCGLKSIVIPNSVTTICDNAFTACSSLAEVTLPSKLTYLEDCVFKYCEELEQIALPSTLKAIGAQVFMESGLTAIEIPASVTSIGNHAFSYSEIKELVIPDTVTSLGVKAFEGCHKLQAAYISASLSTIPEATFASCQSMKMVILPASIKTVEASAFSSCLYLSAIYYLGDVEDLADIVVYNYNDYFLNANVYLAMIASKSPSDVTTSVGGKSATFTAEASHPKAEYQWMYLAPGNEEWHEVINLTGSHSKTLTVPSEAKYNGYQFACYMYRDEGDYGVREAISDPATMTVVPGPAVRYKLPDVMMADGEEAYFEVEATGTGLTYEWYFANAGETSFRKTTTFSGDYYKVEMGTPRDGRRIYCKITDKYGATVTTNTVTLHLGVLGVPQPVLSTNAGGKPVVSWPAAEGAVKYEVWRAESKNGSYTRLSTTAGTTFTNTSAEIGKTYYYKVRSINADGYASSYSAIKSIACDYPAPVVKVTNDAATGKVVLSWEPVENAAKYEVYRSTSKSGEYTKIWADNKTSVTHNGTAGTTYYYKVRAINANGKAGPYSTIVQRTCDYARPVVKTTNNVTTGKVVLSWDAVKGATKYELYRATSKTGTYSRIWSGSTTSVTHTGTAGTTYYYKVRALGGNSNATSAFSAIVQRTCDYARPVVKVTNDAATGKVVLSWETVKGATKYELYRSTSLNGTYTKIWADSKTTVTHSGTPGTTYYYKVRALGSNSNATSAFSAVVQRTCDYAKPVVTVTLNENGKPVLTWDAVKGATKYEVYRATSEDGTYAKIWGSSATTCVHTGAASGTTYYYKVRALGGNANATSVYSAVVSMTAE